jgi:hypothetical protein
MVFNGLLLFMFMSNLILTNINIMDMKKHMLICLFIFMLVGEEKEMRELLEKRVK